MIRLTIRATDEAVPALLLALMVDRLAPGASTRGEQRPDLTRGEIADAFANVMVEG
jgi:AP-2 complex subunit alpha